VIVSTLLPAAGFVLNDAVTPLGRPETVRFTLPLNPPREFTRMVEVPDVPG
jgi:hypothetical protein